MFNKDDRIMLRNLPKIGDIQIQSSIARVRVWVMFKQTNWITIKYLIWTFQLQAWVKGSN